MKRAAKWPLNVPSMSPYHTFNQTGVYNEKFQSDAPVSIRLDINELVATVTRPNVLYTSTAKSRLSLTIRNSETTLTKTYSREANRDSATRPPVKDLENLLNGQLTDIVNQILQDVELRNTIRKK